MSNVQGVGRGEGGGGGGREMGMPAEALKPKEKNTVGAVF